MTWRPSERDLQKLRRLIAEGMTVGAAGKVLGVSDRTIQRRAAADESFSKLVQDALHAQKALRKQNIHGTPAAYGHGGCRCEKCRAANTAKMRKSRKNMRLTSPRVHGLSGYRNHACPCEVCQAAGKDNNRELSAKYPRRQVEANDRTRETAHRYRYQWTGPELDIATRPDLSLAQAARLLGRTIDGVRWARRQVDADPRKRRITDAHGQASGF